MGVATSTFVPIKRFKGIDKDGKELQNYLIGFGNFESEDTLKAYEIKDDVDDILYRKYPDSRIKSQDKNSINEYYSRASIKELDFSFGGNYRSYFGQSLDLQNREEDLVTQKVGEELLVAENQQEYVPIFSISDPIGIEARSYYEEDYDMGVSVIAGSGRPLQDAEDVWNQFRSSYHTYESVKNIFMDTYGLNPEDNEPFSSEIQEIFGISETTSIFSKYKDSLQSANDEFSLLFGNTITGNQSAAIEYARQNYIDKESTDPGSQGIIQYFNQLTLNKIQSFKSNFLIENDYELRQQSDLTVSKRSELIQTPRELFLTLVGLFRQKMWQDPYSRAWLVLKPSRKIGIGIFGIGRGQNWDFKSVDKIFAAFINPSAEYAKRNKSGEFKKLLYQNKGQGSDAGNIFSRTVSGVDSFLDASIGPLFSATGAALSGLMSMFRLNMLQTGYGLSEIGSLSKQANIVNKALNDSIYYSLGRPGSLLRAVDNPFTREYAEPVIEVREPFQRMHYLSSFSHILSNEIKETNFNVSTVITAVSDGKHPVTVALDKGAPSDRMVESTIETGIYFDNPIGEGFLGFLHPLIHPFETTRGITKNLSGSPDELLAKRIGLAHLKENIKDIYGGELIIIGNSDIRPHDLVYLSDVYERMYGIFEVEQVVHHFTSEMGYVTSITPNALVTVNDPARWYMTSWYHSWMNAQAIRNDTRLFMSTTQANTAGISSGGNISLENLSNNLNSQMMGGIQYTHGSSALIKDTMAVVAYDGFNKNPNMTDAILKQSQMNGNPIGGSATVLAIAASVPLIGQLVWKGWSWVRDNLLDQHGAYVQYLNKNGQPMDAGLSYNQGMVVGRYHSKALLPGILGLRKKTRTIDGHAYIRTDDLLKNLGWKETEITDLVRYISYENALVHAKVLNLSSLGPEKSGFEPFYKVACMLDQKDVTTIPTGRKNLDGTPIYSGIIDGDTIQVRDILNENLTFRVRLDAINTPESTQMSSSYFHRDLQDYTLVRSTVDVKGNEPINDTVVDVTYTQTPGFKSTKFVMNALAGKVFILRVKEKRELNSAVDVDQESYNPRTTPMDPEIREDKYLKDKYDRTLGTIFYKTSSEYLEEIKVYVMSLFIKHSNKEDEIIEEFRENFPDEKVNTSYSFLSVENNYNKIFNKIEAIDHTKNFPVAQSLNSDSLRILFSKLVDIKVIDQLNDTASKWPVVLWDEYYNDGTPYTLNWELVTNNLADVFVKDIQTESDSVSSAQDSSSIPYRYAPPKSSDKEGQ